MEQQYFPNRLFPWAFPGEIMLGEKGWGVKKKKVELTVKPCFSVGENAVAVQQSSTP